MKSELGPLPKVDNRAASDPGRDDMARAAAFRISAPESQLVPVVFASPHSGRAYPRSFLDQSRLDPLALRRSEDAFVDEIFASAPDHGAPLLSAQFPRAFLDANREPFELDPTMFEDPLPAYVNGISPRVASGLGTLPRLAAGGAEIYGAKLRFAEARRRIERYYTPYHDALRALIAQTRERFGRCLVIDCHSMPSRGGAMDTEPGLASVDIVLGDCHGRSCAPSVTRLAEGALRDMGFGVTRNHPYAGGYTTRNYGRPETGVHVLQVEIKRGLYMDEREVTRLPEMEGLRRHVDRFIEAIVTGGAEAMDTQ